MARQLRHHVCGGWYHITARGMGRREIFLDDRDREHFLELLEGLVGRYGVVLHAYVLMDNHYHLLIETPDGNASRALQWLNVSYSVWHNKRKGRCGPLFQARYKSIPVDGQGSWALVCSNYMHLNPVRIKALGLWKKDRAREKAGLLPKDPMPEHIQGRLAVLRKHAWSSYRAYAGYAAAPEWLTRKTLWARVAAEDADAVVAAAAYREQIEDYLKQGMQEGFFDQLTQTLAIGSTAFIETLRKRVAACMGEGTNARAWRRLLPWAEVVRIVVTIKREPWHEFSDRRGDWGRDLALYLGRMRGGMTLHELGAQTGMHALAVSKAVTRLDHRCKTDQRLQRTVRSAVRMLDASEKKA